MPDALDVLRPPCRAPDLDPLDVGLAAAFGPAPAPHDLVPRLEEVRLRCRANDDPLAVDAACAAMFATLGVEVDRRDPAGVAAALSCRDHHLDLAAALDDWASLRRTAPTLAGADWGRLVAVARAVDPDAWRDRIRETSAEADGGRLRRLAVSCLEERLPARTLALLGAALLDLDDAHAAVSILRTAQSEHPGDPWVNCALGDALRRLQPAQASEAVRYYTAAVALRPRSPGLWRRLGTAHLEAGEVRRAADAIQRAARLDPA